MVKYSLKQFLKDTGTALLGFVPITVGLIMISLSNITYTYLTYSASVVVLSIMGWIFLMRTNINSALIYSIININPLFVIITLDIKRRRNK